MSYITSVISELEQETSNHLQHLGITAIIITDMATQDLIVPGASHLQLSPTLAINEAVESVRARGKKVIHLGFGEATFPIQEDVLKVHEDYSRSTSYMPVAGLMSLRQVGHMFQSDLSTLLTLLESSP